MRFKTLLIGGCVFAGLTAVGGCNDGIFNPNSKSEASKPDAAYQLSGLDELKAQLERDLPANVGTADPNMPLGETDIRVIVSYNEKAIDKGGSTLTSAMTLKHPISLERLSKANADISSKLKPTSLKKSIR